MASVLLKRSEQENHFSASAGDFQMNLILGEQRHPRSIDFLLFSLASCIIGTVSHYMKRKNISTKGLAIRLNSDLNEEDNRYGEISVFLELGDDIPDKQVPIISTVAKTCRIHKTIGEKITVDFAITAHEENKP